MVHVFKPIASIWLKKLFTEADASVNHQQCRRLKEGEIFIVSPNPFRYGFIINMFGSNDNQYVDMNNSGVNQPE
jgi:hypothetical protein